MLGITACCVVLLLSIHAAPISKAAAVLTASLAFSGLNNKNGALAFLTPRYSRPISTSLSAESSPADLEKERFNDNLVKSWRNPSMTVYEEKELLDKKLKMINGNPKAACEEYEEMKNIPALKAIERRLLVVDQVMRDMIFLKGSLKKSKELERERTQTEGVEPFQ